MKFQAGIFTPNLSGSAGGTTASRNRGGGYFRNKAVPTNPDTVFQQAARAILAAFSQKLARSYSSSKGCVRCGRKQLHYH